MKKIIIDTDPGIDDALALCYALSHPELELLALTTIFGNVSTDLATENALRLCELTGKTVAVAKGANVPLEIAPNPVADFVHGNNGFGEIALPAPSLSASNLSAAELIVDLVHKHPNDITLIAVGPLTNLALALELSPDIAELVAEVVIMGGAFHCKGNVTEAAEANLWNDPHAGQRVFNASWPVTVHGLDVTLKIQFSAEYLETLAKNSPRVGSFLRDAGKFYIEFYERQYDMVGCCPHDLLALSYATNPDWFTLEHGALDVITDTESPGKTSIDSAVRSNKSIAVAVDRDALLSDYTDILKLAK